MNSLRRTLGTRDAVVIGLGSMIGAGIFSALGPAAHAAGPWLLLALAVATVVAYCNATSTARLAAVHPSSGGTYLYATRQLSPFWGYLAGWSFVVGKTASCAAMAMTVGAYAWPGREVPVAVATVVALVALNCLGVQKSVALTRVIVTVVVLVLTVLVFSAWVLPADQAPVAAAQAGALGVIQGAGLVFFAFAGYARIATLGEEVRDPSRTIPRAVPIALAIAFVVYALVAASALHVLGAGGLSASTAPLLDVARSVAPGWLPAVVQVGAVLAATGSLLALVLGVSRTSLAMARDGHLPGALTTVSESRGVPWVAEVAVGVLVVALVLTVDLRGAIGFSSFGVLLYYAIANASAFTLNPEQGRPAAWIPVTGLIGCLVLAVGLPAASVIGGAIVVALGALVFVARHRG